MGTLKQRIAESARALFLDEGLAGVSMRRVAERVGVSAPALYRYYRNKDELLDEIVAEGLRTLEGYLRPALDAPDPGARLHALVDAYVRFAVEQPKYFDFAFLTPTPPVGRFGEELRRRDWRVFISAVEQVSGCMEAGILRRDDALETAITLWAQIHGLVSIYRVGRFGDEPERFRELCRRSVERVLAGLAPPGS